jgi:uncharacterized hydrophobic protein (TIGR00271 family)
MHFSNLFKISQTERNKFCTYIIDSSAPTADFYFLVILSTLIVAMGLLADNVILVIGGMLVTPILSPILAISLGILISEKKVIIRSFRILLMSFAFAFAVAFITGLISSASVKEVGLISIMKPSLFILLIAVVAGLAASFTWVKPALNDNLPGVAVTVTLIPPLTAVGLTLAKGEWLILRDVLNVLLINISGIIVASLVVFSLMDFYQAKKKVIAEVKEEEKLIEKEEKVKANEKN